MSNFICQWLARPARHGLATLGLLALCFAAALFSRPSLHASVASAVAVSATAEAGPEVASTWPRAALRLWFVLPRVSLP
jgi:hypothetical protein